MDILTKLSRTANSSEFWNQMKIVRKNTPNNQDSKTHKAVWEGFYQNLYKITSLNQELWNGAGIYDPLLEGNFTIFELNRILRKLKEKTTPGPDQIPSCMFKKMTKNGKNKLLSILNNILCHQYLPDSWAQTRISPIHKDGPVDRPENYRPIAVINQICKILTALLANRIQYWAELNEKFPEEQNAFRINRSTMEHIYVLKALIDQQIGAKNRLIM